ncbi:MAG: lysozyme inhibitor LprI family protein [Steroidobacter sp.]
MKRCYRTARATALDTLQLDEGRMTRLAKMRFMILTTLLIALTALFVALAAMAADSSPRCNPAGTQAQMNTCATNELAEADRQLNATYQSLLKKYADDAAFIQKLRAAQRAWVAFRDAELDATYWCMEPNPAACWGSLLPQRYASYKSKLTSERTERLRRLLAKGPPADGSSP